jgi:hypothetical protein
MPTLNTAYGWSQGDQIRLLIASGLSVGSYQLSVITQSMNDLGTLSTLAVSNVLDLVDQFENAQAKLVDLNTNSNGRILIKADVLEWESAKGDNIYNPQMEIQRIRIQLYQYMSLCPLFANPPQPNGNTPLHRS